MTPSRRFVRYSVAACLLFCLVFAFGLPDSGDRPPKGTAVTGFGTSITEAARANDLIRRQPGFFVPNLGQWGHAARFVHRSGPMTLFLEDRGWVIDLVDRPAEPKAKPHVGHQAMPDDREGAQKTRGVALRMIFAGDGHVPEIVGEKKLPGYHNYFLGNDENGWRADVPLYSSVRYEDLYSGIDLRLREMNGVPEYDLLLQPGADLSQVIVHVEGAERLSIAKDGSLVIETVLGPLTQLAPKTWQVDLAGRRRELACNFTLLGADRFGFSAPGWDGDTCLTIDPGLIWSTFLGTNGYETASALAVDASGVVTVAGWTGSATFPTTTGAYDTTYNGGWDIFVSRLDPSKTGTAQLIFSTFLGGYGGVDWSPVLTVDAAGVVTLTGQTQSFDFPVTRDAYDRTHNSGSKGDVFVSRLDPSKTGTAQLVYSTFLGGTSWETPSALGVDAFGVIAVTGHTWSTDFPMTSGAYDTTYNGGNRDVFVSRLDLSKVGTAQLVYSTFLGGDDFEFPGRLSVDAIGVVTVVGRTCSTNYPTTRGAYDTTYNGDNWSAFVSCLDPNKTGSAQLVYSTLLGGRSDDFAGGLFVDASGVVTVAGSTESTDFPTTRGAYDTTFNGPWHSSDVFVSRLDPSKTGNAQLVYSTYLGGSDSEHTGLLAVDASGVVTVAGVVASRNFPTTRGAYDTTLDGIVDAFVSRLDPSKMGNAQLVYSTFLGGTRVDSLWALAVDASGVVTVAGPTRSPDFPTTRGAYDTTYNGGTGDIFISRLDMGVAMYGDVHEIPIKSGGTQVLTVNAGKAHRNRRYWIFGSVTGTRPGVNLFGVHLPLNPDAYTNVAMATVNTSVFTKFRGSLDANGLATASFRVPANLPLPSGFTFYHAYVVYDASGKFHMTSNAVPLRLR